jgi:hypothetical protein
LKILARMRCSLGVFLRALYLKEVIFGGGRSGLLTIKVCLASLISYQGANHGL